MEMRSTRRRVVAALAAAGAGGLLPTLSRAQSITTPCLFRQVEGTYANPENVYEVSGKRGVFGYVTEMRSVGEEITLFADPAQGGIAKAGPALVKGTLTRGTMFDPLIIEQIGFEMPLTALARDGQYYGIVQMAFDQNARTGVIFYYDGQRVGGFELLKGQFDPNSREVAFSGEAANQLYGWMMGDKPFRMSLDVGEQTYAELTVEPGGLRTFLVEQVIPKMDEMAASELAGTCGLGADDSFADPYAGCFLTTACCGVVGLADDCWELSQLRRFRDGWMAGFASGRADIARYRREAPAVAARLGATPEGRAELLRLYWTVIVPAAVLARLGANRLAYRLYRSMMVQLLDAK